MKVLIADDEELASSRIKKLVEESGKAHQIFVAATGKATVELINRVQPDLLFLDIQMTDMTGFEVLAQIPSDCRPVVIFVTAYDNFALQAFEIHALDYLLKPYKKERFLEALDRGINRLHIEGKKSYEKELNTLLDFLSNAKEGASPATNTYLSKIVLKKGKSYYFVPTLSIKYIVSSAYYAELFTADQKKHLYRISLNLLISKLDPVDFARVNRSTIINMNELKEVVSEGHGDYSIVMKDNRSFSLTKNFRAGFLETVKIN